MYQQVPSSPAHPNFYTWPMSPYHFMPQQYSMTSHSSPVSSQEGQNQLTESPNSSNEEANIIQFMKIDKQSGMEEFANVRLIGLLPDVCRAESIIYRIVGSLSHRCRADGTFGYIRGSEISMAILDTTAHKQ